MCLCTRSQLQAKLLQESAHVMESYNDIVAELNRRTTAVHMWISLAISGLALLVSAIALVASLLPR